MHVHLVKFQILDKTDMTTGQPIPLQPWEANTWKDIVHIPPNVRARIIMDFEDYPGRFPNHCHLLDHEDHEMMRQFQATFDPAICNNDGTCGSGEDSISCPNDCQQVGGWFCGNGLCESGDGENCATCAEDCGGRQKGGQQNQFCCGFDDGQVTNSIGCGVDINDDRCIDASAGLACRVTARLSASCGDSLCEGQEQVQGNNPDTYCQVDCNPQTCTPTGTPETICNGVDDNCNFLVDEDYVEQPTSCGVGVCAANGNTTCSGGVEGDNCTPGDPTEPGAEVSCTDGLDNDCDGLTDANDPDCAVCVPDETPEQSCFDGSDNDCDTQTDCSDLADCDGVADPTRPTSCGVGVCASTGSIACSGGGEVDTCTPGTPGVEGPEGDATCSDGIDNDCDGDTDANDADCQGAVVCEDITSKNVCNNELNCSWSGSPQNGTCNTVGGGVCTDGDGDGYGDPGDASCPNGAQTDCDDTLASVNPGASEGPEGDPTCSDGLDNNCNGDTDAADAACQPPASCDNDGVCEVGEDCNNCSNDCAGVTGGKPANRYCCGNGIQESAEGDGTICDGNF